MGFKRSSYLRGTPGSLKSAVQEKLLALGGDIAKAERVVLLCQPSCFGVYFSPINMYFCYNAEGQASYMLAEVSNTPWNERHYYLVDLTSCQPSPKDFHVSPFMGLDMQYHWHISPPDSRVRVHIENRNDNKLFDATLNMQRKALNRETLKHVLRSHPVMVLSLLKGIYWQALRLFIKRTPLHLHPERS